MGEESDEGDQQGQQVQENRATGMPAERADAVVTTEPEWDTARTAQPRFQEQ